MSHNPPPQNINNMNFNPNDDSAPGTRRASNPPSASAATAANNDADDSPLSLLAGDIPLDFDGFHNDALYMSNLLSAPAAAARNAAAHNASGGNEATKTSPSAYQSYATNDISSAEIAASAVDLAATSAVPLSAADMTNNADPTKSARRSSSVVSIDSQNEQDFISAVQSSANTGNASSISAPNASISAAMMAHQPTYQQPYRVDDNNQKPHPQPQPSHQQQAFLNSQVNQFLQGAPNTIGSTGMATNMPSALSSSMMPMMATSMAPNMASATASNSNSATASTGMGYPSLESIQFPSISQVISTNTSSNNFATYNTNAGSASSINNINYSNSNATFNQAFHQPVASSAALPQSGAGPRFRAFHEKKWDERLLELRAFRQQHGHSLVPHTYPSNPQLARWVKRQRRQHKLMEEGKQSTMTPERCELLESLGFVWDSHQAAWSEKIQDLRRYQAQNGHCLVPSSYKANPQLATWVKCQRRQYKLYWEGRPSAMTPQRIAELEGMGFVWELRSASAASKSSPSL